MIFMRSNLSSNSIRSPSLNRIPPINLGSYLLHLSHLHIFFHFLFRIFRQTSISIKPMFKQMLSDLQQRPPLPRSNPQHFLNQKMPRSTHFRSHTSKPPLQNLPRNFLFILSIKRMRISK